MMDRNFFFQETHHELMVDNRIMQVKVSGNSNHSSEESFHQDKLRVRLAQSILGDVVDCYLCIYNYINDYTISILHMSFANEEKNQYVFERMVRIVRVG